MPGSGRGTEGSIIDRERFLLVRKIFTEALTLGEEERRLFLDSACAQDDRLRVEVGDILAYHAKGSDPLDLPLPWPDASSVPSQIGPYRVLDLVGQGGMGVVYRAQAPHGEEAAPVVALKVLRPGIVTPQLERRFRREIDVLQRLEHPGIARLLDAGSADGSPYLAMEFVEGVTLARWRTDADPPMTDRLRLLADLCDAVHFAHEHGIVHRDLKPENILVTTEGTPKVLDFGIARLTDNEDPSQTLATQTWQLLGTIRYMSPEQASGGPGAMDARTDIYALGVIAYELFSGRLPYDLKRLSTPRALLEIMTAQPRRLDGHHASVELIVHHALEKKPARRYQTAAAMAADLRRHLAGLSISLRRPGLPARLRERLRARPRLRRLVLGLGIAAVATAATLVLSPVLRPTAPATWNGFYALVEQADQLRHSGPATPANYLEAAALFQRARGDLSRLPIEPFTADLNRYLKWRLGELHFFVGEIEHDPAMLEQARGYWRDASVVPWTPGTAKGIDAQAIVRDKVLRLGLHHPLSGIGFALAGLAQLGSPASNWREASLAQEAAVFLCRDKIGNYQDYRPNARDAETWTEDMTYALLNYGGSLTALGAVVDSLSVVERGFAKLRESAAVAETRPFGGGSVLGGAFAAGYFRRAGLQSAAAAAADVDSALAYLDRAAQLRDLGSGRSYWRLYLLRGQVRERAAALAPEAGLQRLHLQAAAADIRTSFAPLKTGADDFERALAQAELAGVTAQLAALDRDRPGFARADSLLILAEGVLTSSRFPVQYAEVALRRGQVLRLRWEAFGDARDTAASAEALARARGAVPHGQYPALHRRVEAEEMALAGRSR